MSLKGKDARSLTAREKEVLRWLYNEKSNWEIGMILDLSQYTVKNHVSNILKKLEANNRQHAAVIGAAQGLIEDEPQRVCQ